MNPWLIAIAVALPAALLAWFGGRELQRRHTSRTGASAVDALREARLDAQRILSRAEEESRALAESYREREEAAVHGVPDHRDGDDDEDPVLAFEIPAKLQVIFDPEASWPVDPDHLEAEEETLLRDTVDVLLRTGRTENISIRLELT